ncbi:C-type mannose receptor 2-like [Tachysurus vachellii]|uniref:C-type mannose receptor 2-like n=1 Tax=Tachysurus vachellii TaxID=175792 RepID=UPI00296B0D01|nr:C-type mannose receptor 2-like [Tachysurus vachellii]
MQKLGVDCDRTNEIRVVIDAPDHQSVSSRHYLERVGFDPGMRHVRAGFPRVKDLFGGGATSTWVCVLSCTALTCPPLTHPLRSRHIYIKYIFLDLAVKGAFSKNCPTGWTSYSGRCYLYNAAKLDWVSAETFCQKFDAHLVSIHSENQYQQIKSLICTHDPAQNPTYIGLSDCQKPYKYFWSDGTKLAFTKWNPGQPDNYNNNERCVYMNAGTLKTGMILLVTTPMPLCVPRKVAETLPTASHHI